MNDIIAIYSICNTASVSIIGIEYGIEDKVLYLDTLGKKHKAKIHYSEKGDYFNYCGGWRIYLNECMRV